MRRKAAGLRTGSRNVRTVAGFGFFGFEGLASSLDLSYTALRTLARPSPMLEGGVSGRKEG
jgi:hypothetical protein